jgi:hypothetical protein
VVWGSVLVDGLVGWNVPRGMSLDPMNILVTIYAVAFLIYIYRDHV